LASSLTRMWLAEADTAAAVPTRAVRKRKIWMSRHIFFQARASWRAHTELALGLAAFHPIGFRFLSSSCAHAAGGQVLQRSTHSTQTNRDTNGGLWEVRAPARQSARSTKDFCILGRLVLKEALQGSTWQKGERFLRVECTRRVVRY
jgi:hypothetical protein